MKDNLDQILAVRFARAYIGYVTGVSETSMAKKIPDNAEVGELWLNVAKYVIETMKQREIV